MYPADVGSPYLKKMSITGKHTVTTLCSNGSGVIQEILLENLKQELYNLLMNQMRSTTDGRAYVITYTWNTQPSVDHVKLSLSAIILLFDPRQAEVGEYVSLGAVETLLKANSFIHIGNKLMFERDDVGWKRIATSPIEIDDAIRRLRDEE